MAIGQANPHCCGRTCGIGRDIRDYDLAAQSGQRGLRAGAGQGPAHGAAGAGEVAAVQVATEPRALPALAFTDAAGAHKTLADWHGRTVLLNLWATWCVPCRREMPALQALQQKLGGKDFEVVAVNIDTRDPEKPKAWLRDVGVDQLAYYADPSAKVFQDLKLIGKGFGMPTTLLIDPSGCEIATLAGPAEWASDDAVNLVKAALGT